MYRINEFHIRFTKDLTRVLAIKKLAQNHFALLSKKKPEYNYRFLQHQQAKISQSIHGF